MQHFRKGGIHPPTCKLTADKAIVAAPLPPVVTIMLSQHIGAPARCVVKPGQHVEAGELIGEASGFVSANIHTPVAGTVKKVEPARDLQGIWRPAVIIEVSGEPGVSGERRAESGEELQSGEESKREKETEGIASPLSTLHSPLDIIEAIKRAGIVGLGGATFPTHVKLTLPPGKKADYLLLNGAECEPYLTCDDRLMREHPAEIVRGLELLMKAVDAPKGIIGIEANKPEAIAAMREAAAGNPAISIAELRTAYPQGSEKQLIEALTGRRVPTGGLPIDVGTVVDNVATAYAVRNAVDCGRPLTERLVTVTGPSLANPGNFLVADGTPVSDLIEMAGGLPADTGKIIAGGPMMGRAVSNPEAPAVKGLSGIVVLPRSESERPEAGPCLRCGACVRACPMGLEPYLLMTMGQLHLDDEARDHGVLNCLECGSCSYVCPAARPILDYIKLSRINLKKK